MQIRADGSEGAAAHGGKRSVKPSTGIITSGLGYGPGFRRQIIYASCYRPLRSRDGSYQGTGKSTGGEPRRFVHPDREILRDRSFRSLTSRGRRTDLSDHPLGIARAHRERLDSEGEGTILCIPPWSATQTAVDSGRAIPISLNLYRGPTIMLGDRGGVCEGTACIVRIWPNKAKFLWEIASFFAM